MARQNFDAGKVQLTSGGKWSSTKTYEKLTHVVHNGDSWYNLDSCTGLEPSDDSSVWVRQTNLSQIVSQVNTAAQRAQTAATTAQAVVETVNTAVGNIETAMAALPDGQAVSAQVAVNKVDITELKERVSLNEDTLEAVDDSLNVLPDYPALPLLCGQPPILFGAGTPQEEIVPDNWKQYDPVTNTGYQWNGQPSAVGQQYINTSATSGGRYIAVADANMNLTWKNF